MSKLNEVCKLAKKLYIEECGSNEFRTNEIVSKKNTMHYVKLLNLITNDDDIKLRNMLTKVYTNGIHDFLPSIICSLEICMEFDTLEEDMISEECQNIDTIMLNHKMWILNKYNLHRFLPIDNVSDEITANMLFNNIGNANDIDRVNNTTGITWTYKYDLYTDYLTSAKIYGIRNISDRTYKLLSGNGLEICDLIIEVLDGLPMYKDTFTIESMEHYAGRLKFIIECYGSYIGSRT